MHLEWLKCVKSTLKNKGPWTPSYLKHKAKKLQTKGELQAEILRKNDILIGHMMEIQHVRGSYDPTW